MIDKVLLLAVVATVCSCAILPDSSRVVLKEDDLQEPTNPPIPYNFEYDSRDQNGTMLFRRESKDGSGKVEGRYGYKDMHGIERIVEYVADKDGYRAKIRTNEPGVDRTNSAGVEFYADTSNRHVQIAKKQGEYMADAAAVTYNTDATAEEMKNLPITEKADAAEMTTTQYSGALSHPSTLRTGHHLFPRRQSHFLRQNQYAAPLNSVQYEEPKEIPATPSNKDKGSPQVLHYAQQFPASTSGHQQFQILNAQVPAIQYQAQPQFIPADRRLVAIPYSQFYVPQNQQSVALQNGALSSTTHVQATQVVPPQPFYSLAGQPQQGSLVTSPLSYAQSTTSKGTEYAPYTPLGRRIPGLSEYFQ